MKHFKLPVFLLSLSLCLPACAVDYGQLMTKKVKAALGKNAVKGYVFATYPLDNFGLATAYDGKQQAQNEICATWECLGVEDDKTLAGFSDDDKLKLVAGGIQYANVGTGPSISLTEEEKKSIGLNAILPTLLKVLNITADLSHTDDISTTLTTGPISVRVLRRDDMVKKIASSEGNAAEKAASSTGNLVLVYSDIVITSMKIEIKPNPETKADLDAKLSSALSGKIGSVFGTGSDLSFKLDNSTKGDYSFTVTKPLILAVYVKRQPKPGVLGDQKGWGDWSNVDMGSANKVTANHVDLPGIE